MRKNIIKIIFAIITLFISIYSIILLHNLNVLPNKYLYIYDFGLILINIISIIFSFTKIKILKIISYILKLIILIISVLVIINVNNINKFFNKSFNNLSESTNNYQVYVLKSSSITSFNQIRELGIFNKDDSIEEVKKILTINNSNFISISYDDLDEISSDLLNKNIESIVLDEGYTSLLDDSFFEKTKVIYEFELKEEKEEETKEEDVSELKPINIFISGSDSRSNNISLKSRSDVNMIITINPQTKTVLMTSIPRDYYVSLYGKTGLKDKLTHSGIYGLDTTVKTVENLFDIQIDYSIKVGFGSVVNIVDAIGGIDIESDQAFTTLCNDGGAVRVNVKKGINHFNGAEALSYARERYAYSSGDRHRILNQQQVLSAVINKLISDKTYLLNYNEILNSLSDLYKTDIPSDYIKLLVNAELNNMGGWNFISNSVSGSDAKMETYTMPSRKLYVMVPYEDDVKNARIKILNVLSEN